MASAPKRRAQDAIAEIHYLASPTRNYGWVFEADIEACFDEIDHAALMDRVRRSDRGQAGPGVGEGVPAGGDPHRRGPQPRDDHRHTRKAGSSHRCWPTSPCPSSTSTSPRKWAGARPGMDACQAPPRRRRRSCGSSATRTTSWSCVAGHRADAEALRDEVAHGARSDGPAPVGRRRRGSATSTRGSTSSAGVSSADAGEAEPANERSTPTRRRRRSRSIIGQGPIAHPPSETSNARRPAAPVEPDAARLVQLLPARRVETDVQLPRSLRLLADRRLAPQTTRRAEHAHPGPSPPPPLEDPRRRHRDVPTLQGRHRTLPIPGRSHPDTMDERTPPPRHEHVESRMRGNMHVRFGGRAGETHPTTTRHRAPVRPLHRAPDRERASSTAARSRTCSRTGSSAGRSTSA